MFYVVSVTGNTNLNKLSPSSLRRAGLCEDHFNKDSFSKKGKNGLKRDAVPIPFDSSAAQKEPIQINKKRRINAEIEQTLNAEETNIMGLSQPAKKTATSAPILDNMMIEEQPLEGPTLKTYRSSHLYFDSSAEKEDVMEWVHIEPSVREKIPDPLPSDNINKEENNTNKQKNVAENNATIISNLYKEIHSLKCKNIRLQNHIKILKHRLRIAQILKKPKVPKKHKQRKKILKELIYEQDLHPVAKAMINLQLHTPNAAYTEEEKNLSRQLYYYSAAAFHRLKKAGCNFPGQRTVRRWLEEYDIRPGFCDFIFQKLKEKIACIPMEERVCALKWDEMCIKSYEEYSLKLDQVEGLVDLEPLGRKSERAKCVFVFCLDSLNARNPWRQPLAYFLPGKCMKAEEIILLLKECLDRLNETGADVQLVTCDQGTCNQSAYTQLGIDAQKPFFIYNKKNITLRLIFHIW